MQNPDIVRNEEYERRAIEVISAARHSIFFSTFKVYLTKEEKKGGCNKIFSALLEKAREGIEVKAMLQCGYDGTSLSNLNRIAAKKLIAAGAKVKHLEGRRVVHAKIILVDGLFLLSGSHNWSVGSLRRNFEISFYFWGLGVVQPVVSFCEKEWDRAFDFRP